MDKKPASSYRGHFRVSAITSTPTLLVSKGEREAVMIINEGPSAVYLGISGTPTNKWMYLPKDVPFFDNYSIDEWWAITLTSSGTVSGYRVVG